MPDLSNAEISVEGEYGECLVCGESFHWEQLTNTQEGPYCDDHLPDDPQPRQHDRGWVPSDTSRREWAKAMYQHAQNLRAGADDEGDMGHDTNLERDTFGDAL